MTYLRQMAYPRQMTYPRQMAYPCIHQMTYPCISSADHIFIYIIPGKFSLLVTLRLQIENDFPDEDKLMVSLFLFSWSLCSGQEKTGLCLLVKTLIYGILVTRPPLHENKVLPVKMCSDTFLHNAKCISKQAHLIN